mgnify:CR=1 FL=1
MNKKIVVIGGGGHASVLIDILTRMNMSIHAYISPEPSKRAIFIGIPHWASDDLLSTLHPDEYVIVNGIGSMPGSRLREAMGHSCRKLGLKFMTVISPDAYVSNHAVLSEGVQVMAKSVIQPGCEIGEDVIINTGSIVEHDCKLDRLSHLAPGAVLSGGVILGSRSHIGTNATVIQNVIIGANTVVGASAIINKNIDAGSVIYPARPFIRSVNDVK